jgi:hypothetical protein
VDRSRGRFATPADFPLEDCSAYSHVHARRESLGFVPRSRSIFCRPAPNPAIRNFCIAAMYAPRTGSTERALRFAQLLQRLLRHVLVTIAVRRV